MILAFYVFRYDFDNDGMLQREDVRTLLSYVPFKSEEELLKEKSTMSVISDVKSNQEGLYDSSNKDYFTRKHEQDEINRFIEDIFGVKSQINFKDYQRLNSEVSSEMFTSLMRVLHDTLPCSQNYFHKKR